MEIKWRIHSLTNNTWTDVTVVEGQLSCLQRPRFCLYWRLFWSDKKTKDKRQCNLYIYICVCVCVRVVQKFEANHWKESHSWTFLAEFWEWASCPQDGSQECWRENTSWKGFTRFQDAPDSLIPSGWCLKLY